MRKKRSETSQPVRFGGIFAEIPPNHRFPPLYNEGSQKVLENQLILAQADPSPGFDPPKMGVRDPGLGPKFGVFLGISGFWGFGGWGPNCAFFREIGRVVRLREKPTNRGKTLK